MRRLCLSAACGLLAVLGIAAAGSAQEEVEEVALSVKEIARLDIFEDRAIAKAQAAFGRGEYARASAEYDDFLKKFPNSPVTAYALLRKGRCAELDGKRPEAIESYQAVAQRFPKAAKYAVPAQLYLAECYVKDANVDGAAKVWTEIAENPDYGESAAAGEALLKLAETLSKQEKHDEALKYYQRIAMSGRDAGGELAQQAIKTIVKQHVRIAPDEAKLRELYKQIRPEEDPETKDPGESSAYWKWVVEAVVENGYFSWSERELSKKYYESWIGVMEGKFPESDDFQIALATLHYKADRDRDKLAERLDAQFKKSPEKGDWKRIVKWIKAYKGNWTKTREYAAMVDFENAGIDGMSQLIDVLCNELQESYLAKSTFQQFCEKASLEKLSNDELRKLIRLALGTLKDNSTAKTLAEKLHLEEMPEQQKLELARELLQLDGGVARAVYDRLQDQEAGKLELFEHYCTAGESYQALALADELIKVEKYAAGVGWKKAEMLQAAKRYSEAVAAYELAGNPPANLWQIVECRVAGEQPEEAVRQLRGIEAQFPGDAAKAAYRIACIYGDAEEKEPHIAALRRVMKNYPGSDEAGKAEKELDELSVPPAMPKVPLGLGLGD